MFVVAYVVLHIAFIYTSISQIVSSDTPGLQEVKASVP
jgi:hypothetical protein